MKENEETGEIARVDCVVPAAGRSERMGQWKPVLPFGTGTIIGTVVETALRACARVILVTGYRSGELVALFQGEKRVRIVENPGWDRGMFSSVVCGAAQVDTEWFFVDLGDMPWIQPRVFRSLLTHKERDVVFPCFRGRRGHPVLFSRRVIPAVLGADTRSGSMKEIAAGFSFAELPWEDDTILRDIDTMEDYH